MTLSLGLIFLTYYFDKTIRDEEDIEKLIGLPILGTVPVYKGGKH
jgi:capsular polysaccharide biosynthesis protein